MQDNAPQDGEDLSGQPLLHERLLLRGCQLDHGMRVLGPPSSRLALHITSNPTSDGVTEIRRTHNSVRHCETGAVDGVGKEDVKRGGEMKEDLCRSRDEVLRRIRNDAKEWNKGPDAREIQYRAAGVGFSQDRSGPKKRLCPTLRTRRVARKKQSGRLGRSLPPEHVEACFSLWVNHTSWS